MPETRTASPSHPDSEPGGPAPAADISPSEVSYSRVIRSVLIFAVVGAVLYAAATLASDYHTTIKALASFPLKLLFLVLLLVAIGWVLRGWRFAYYLAQVGHKLPFGYALEVFLASFALTGTPGKMGEAAKGVFLKEDYGISFTRVVGILVVERLMDLWGVLLLASFSFLLFSEWRGAFFICAAAVVFGGIFLSMERVYRPVLERIGRIPVLAWPAQKLLGVLLTGRELMTLKIFLVGLVISTVAWGLESVSLYLVLRGLDLSVTLLEANFAYSFSTLVGALSMLPGGIGSTEAGMVGILAFLGIGYSSALPAVLLIRVCTLWFAILVGIVFMAFLISRSGKR
ncbi:MAG: lysylphosphatidylglycerol synthase transmembrane domain-containing protein [Thermodesulfobacteriota bacterium]